MGDLPARVNSIGYNGDLRGNWKRDCKQPHWFHLIHMTDNGGATSSTAAYSIETESPMPVTLISFDARPEGGTCEPAMGYVQRRK